MGCCCSGGFLTTAAALVAIQVAQDRTPEELSLLGAFFTSLGDNLELMSTAQEVCPSPGQLPEPAGPVLPA